MKIFNSGPDENFRRIRRYLRDGVHALPSASTRYLIQKVPAVQWISNYSPRWIINDFIAGLTVGVILVPQALAYAKIASIPLQDGLLASWLPSALYFIMGTSKDISTGPTSIIGLLTAQIIKDVAADGYTPTMIAVAISFSVGIYCLILGILKLGFLLEFVSHPVLTGFISAAAITIILGQIPAILGETGVGTTVADEIHDIITKIPKTEPITLAVGLGGMFLLIIIQMIGQQWGKKSKVVWGLSIGRNALVIVLFTIMSFFLNRSLETPLFAVTGSIPSGLVAPKAPDLALVMRVFPSSVAVFIAAALEHIGIAKSFGRKNKYSIDQSQELTFLGVANLLNSLFGGMAVGGAASRTAVNSESGVKSPLSGIFTSGAVLLSIFFLTGALFWIPKATLSAVIIVAVWQIIAPAQVFISYWKISFADFTASQIAFWVTLFVSAELGIESATAFMISTSIIQTVFSKGKTITRNNFYKFYAGFSGNYTSLEVPEGTQIVRFNYPIIFANATLAKSSVLDAVQTYNLGLPSDSTSKNPDRLWNELRGQHIALIRNKVGISSNEADCLPQIKVVVLDLQGVRYIDTTGVEALKDMTAELKVYGGEGTEIRFVGLKASLVGKFERAGWKFVYKYEAGFNEGYEHRVRLYESLEEAIFTPGSLHSEEFGEKEDVIKDELERIH